jgi:glycosyltransferase involved in cell wall biosynthesis
VIYNSVDIREFPRRTQRETSGARTILAVGRLDRKKGFDILLAACSILRERRVPYHCVIVGDGRERSNLEGLRRSLKLESSVDLKGNLSFAQVREWLYQSDVLAVSSVVAPDGETDGLPTVVIEAMASGLPIAATDTGGISEAVQDGITGYVVPANDACSLADRLQVLLESPELMERFGAEGRRVAETKFDIRQKSEALTQLFVDQLPHSFKEVEGC